MNFFKQAQEFAAAHTPSPPAGDSSAAPGTAPDGAEGNVPGVRKAPSNEELIHSGQLLFGAAQGQKVETPQLAGAAADILGGLESHGNLDQGTYGKYIDQAEEYLDKYSAKGQPAAAPGAPPASAKAVSDGPAASQTDPAVPADQSDGLSQTPPDRTVVPDTAPVNSGSTDAQAVQQGVPSSTGGNQI